MLTSSVVLAEPEDLLIIKDGEGRLCISCRCVLARVVHKKRQRVCTCQTPRVLGCIPCPVLVS